MANNLTWAPSQENIATTLNGAINGTITTIAVTDASKFVTPTWAVIDRVDASGSLKSTTLWEYVYIASKVANDLTVVRGQGGSTAQAHSNGAQIELVLTAGAWNGLATILSSITSDDGRMLSIPSAASINFLNFNRLAGSSIASIAQIQTQSLQTLDAAVQSLVSISVADIQTLRIGSVDAMGAWNNWTPTVSISDGVLANPSIHYARYKQLGALTAYQIGFSGNPTTGSPGYWSFSLPTVASAKNFATGNQVVSAPGYGAVFNSGVTAGSSGIGTTAMPFLVNATTVNVYRSDGAGISLGNNSGFSVTGIYEKL